MISGLIQFLLNIKINLCIFIKIIENYNLNSVLFIKYRHNE